MTKTRSEDDCCICNRCGKTVLGSARDKNCRNCKKRSRNHKDEKTAAGKSTVIKKTAIKREIRKHQMRSSPAAVDALEAGIGDMLTGVLGDAAVLAQYAGRKTVQLRDLDFAARLSQRK